MVTILSQPDAISFSFNLKRIKATCSVNIAVQLYMGEDLIFDKIYAPGTLGNVEIDLRYIIDPLLSVLLPTTGAAVTDQIFAAADFTAVIDGTEIEFRTIKGGVQDLEESASDFVEDHFLTWQPQQKLTPQFHPQWLTIYAVDTRVVKVTAYSYDQNIVPGVGIGAPSGEQTLTLATIPAGSMQTIDISWSAIAADSSLSDIIAWDVWFEDNSGTRMSYIQRYILRNTTDEENQFIWVNTLGGIDSVSFHGSAEYDRKLEHKISELFDDSLEEYNTKKKAENKQSTGFLTYQESLWIEDLLYSKRRYKIAADGSVKAIVIVSSKAISSTEDDMQEFEFNYRLSSDSLLLNIDRTQSALPAPEGLTDFFLNELLSGLTSALYQGNLNIAVQSPYVQGWQRISFNELWYAALPGLIDGITIKFIDGKLIAQGGSGSGDSQTRKPKHGFEVAAGSVLTLNDIALEFTIAGEDFPVWNMGERRLKNTETIEIFATAELWHVYYKDIELQGNQLVATEDLWDRNLDIPIATIKLVNEQWLMTDNRYTFQEVNHSHLTRFEDRPHPALDIYTETGKFLNLLTEAEKTVQKALDKIDYLLKVTEIEFENTSEPAIENYNEDYAPRYGQNPSVRMIIYDGENELDLYQAPVRYKTNALIQRIAWNLGTEFSGKITLSR